MLTAGLSFDGLSGLGYTAVLMFISFISELMGFEKSVWDTSPRGLVFRGPLWLCRQCFRIGHNHLVVQGRQANKMFKGVAKWV